MAAIDVTRFYNQENDSLIIKLGEEAEKAGIKLAKLLTEKGAELATEYITCSDKNISFEFDGKEMFDAMREYYHRQLLQAHENVLRNILQQILNREVVAEDAKRLTRVTHKDFTGQYLILFDNSPIGMIYEHNEGVKFIPDVVTFKHDDPEGFEMQMKQKFGMNRENNKWKFE